MNMEKQAKKFMKNAKSNWSKAKRTYVCRSLKYVRSNALAIEYFAFVSSLTTILLFLLHSET